MLVKNYLLGYDNLYIYQDTEMFNFSLDSVLLANFVTINSRIKEILDIGCGNAPIPIILSTKTKAHITGVEIQSESVDLAIKSIKVNELDEQITIINDDILEFAKKNESDTFDVITCNPPFFKVHEESKYNDNNYKTIARHEVTLSLNDIIIVSRKLLKNGGRLALVHRPERLTEILTILKNNNLEPKKMQLIYPGMNKEANVLLIEAVKNGNFGLKILPPLYTHKKDGNYTDEVLKLFQKN